MSIRNSKTATPEAIQALAETNLDLLIENKDLKEIILIAMKALKEIRAGNGCCSLGCMDGRKVCEPCIAKDALKQIENIAGEK